MEAIPCARQLPVNGTIRLQTQADPGVACGI
jgi:hypothetical protein